MHRSLPTLHLIDLLKVLKICNISINLKKISYCAFKIPDPFQFIEIIFSFKCFSFLKLSLAYGRKEIIFIALFLFSTYIKIKIRNDKYILLLIYHGFTLVLYSENIYLCMTLTGHMR